MKKIMSLFLAIILSQNYFCAVVSDNDGSAFITKAEYDSLKNNFQSQVDAYNTAIDQKIDYAIASYISGIKTETKTNFDGFTEITDSEKYVYGATHDELAIKKQLWNQGSGTFTMMGAGGNVPADVWPFTSAGAVPVPAGQELSRHEPWAYNSDTVMNVKSYMPGFEFDTNGNIKSYYKENNLSLAINTTWYGDDGFSSLTPYILMAGFITGGYTNFNLNQTYEAVLSAANKRYSHRGATGYTLANLKNDYANFLIDVSNSYATTSGFWSLWPETRETFRLLNNTFLVSRVKTDEDKKIYSMNYCDSMIYAFPETSTTVETFIDPYTTTYDVSSKGKEYQFFPTTLPLEEYGAFKACGKYFYDTKIDYDSTTTTEPPTHYPKHFGIFIKKFKLKNNTTKDDYKPILGPETTKKFNNLNQFQNGKLKYKDSNGNEICPKFYGGIPLFNISSNVDSVSFKIKATKTTASATKMRLYIKECEFPNAYYGTATWDNTDSKTGKTYKNSLVVATSDTNTTNTERYLDISFNTETTITLKTINSGKPYFLRFEEVDGSGNTYYGGVITYLSDFSYSTAV